MFQPPRGRRRLQRLTAAAVALVVGGTAWAQMPAALAAAPATSADWPMAGQNLDDTYSGGDSLAHPKLSSRAATDLVSAPDAWPKPVLDAMSSRKRRRGRLRSEVRGPSCLVAAT